MTTADFVSTSAQRGACGQLQDAHCPRRVWNRFTGTAVASADDFLHLLVNGIGVDVECFQVRPAAVAVIGEQAEQQVLGPDVVVLEPDGFL